MFIVREGRYSVPIDEESKPLILAIRNKYYMDKIFSKTSATRTVEALKTKTNPFPANDEEDVTENMIHLEYEGESESSEED